MRTRTRGAAHLDGWRTSVSWLGKIFGGGLGFVIGGPIGAILGAALGHTAFDAQQGGGFGFTRLEQKQSLYFAAVFSMLGKLAKADGVVSRHEIDIIEQVMRDNFRFSPQARTLAIEIFNTAKDFEEPFERFAQQFADEFGHAREVLVSIVDLLLVVAVRRRRAP
ncbi:MAG: TerB family tellurite resistance protein [Gammaproteobacteria bacterium]|nr:TerB family tellurite resistance protein [Gammaproteobacteria bacterium]